MIPVESGLMNYRHFIGNEVEIYRQSLSKLIVALGQKTAHLFWRSGYFRFHPDLRRMAIRISSNLVSLGVCLVIMLNSRISSKLK